MNDEAINRALDLVSSGASRVEQVIAELGPHVWQAEVSYWRAQGIIGICACTLIVAAVAAMFAKVQREKRARNGAMERAIKARDERVRQEREVAKAPQFRGFYYPSNERPDTDEADRHEQSARVWFVFSAVASIGGFITSSVIAFSYVPAAFAPEMYAIRDLLERLGP